MQVSPIAMHHAKPPNTASNSFGSVTPEALEIIRDRPSALLLALALICTPFAVQAGNIDDVLANLNPGEWYEVPNSQMTTADPCPARDCSYSGSGGMQMAILAWNSGAFDTLRNKLLIWGGGHGDYGGNEIYAFDLNTLQWERLTEPSDPPAVDTAYAIDGGPASRHTYNYIQYLPSIDRFCSFGGSAFFGNGQNGTSNTDCFDPATGTWQQMAASVGGIGNITGYDPVTEKVWIHNCGGGSFLSEYASLTNTYTPRGDMFTEPTGWFEYYYTGAVDPGRRKFVAIGNGETLSWDLTQTGFIAFQTEVTTGSQEMENVTAPGFEYDPVIDKFVAWSGGSSVYTLDMDTAVWAQIPAAATNTVTPTAAASNGTNGRFRYIPGKNAYVVVNSATENVYIYKLSTDAGVY